MRMIRKSAFGPSSLRKFAYRITLKSALVWVWLAIDRKSSSYSSHNSVGTSLDVSPHISGNINVYQMLHANRRSRIQVPFSVVVCWYHVRLRILHRLSYCLTQDTYWTSTTGVKQCTFHWLISSDIAQNKMGLNSLIIHHLIIITCIGHEIRFTISLPKLINIALL